MILETYRLRIGDYTGDLAAEDWRRHWRLNGGAMEKKLGREDDSTHLEAWDWRRQWRPCRWGEETTLETSGVEPP